MYGILYVVGDGKKAILAFRLETSTRTYEEKKPMSRDSQLTY